MTYASLPSVITASVAMAFGVLFLVLWSRDRRAHRLLAFGLTSSFVGLYALFGAILRNAPDAATGVRWQFLQGLAVAAAALPFIWFIRLITKQRATWYSRSLQACFFSYLLLSLVSPRGWTWTNEPLERSVQLPFGGIVVHHEMAPGPLIFFLYLCGFALCGLALAWIISFRRAGPGPRATLLLVALSTFLAGLANDALVILGLIQSVRVGDFAFLVMVALISFVLGEEAQESGTIRRELIDRQRRLTETAQMLQQVLDTIPVRVFWKDPASRFLGCNRLFALDSGFRTPDDLVGLDDFAMGWSEQAELYRADDERVMTSEVPKLNYEEPQTTPDGRTIWLRTSKLPLRNADGQVMGVLGTYEDITERQKAQEALERSEENLNITLNSIGDGVIATDEMGHVTRMNPVAEALTGWSGEEAMGRPLDQVFRILHAVSREPLSSPADLALSTGETVALSRDTVLLARDGKERRIADSGAVIRNRESQTTGVVLVFRDITEEHALQELLRQSQKMQAVGQLAGGVAHDFNNLLHAIEGYAELALTAVDPGHPAIAHMTEVRRTAGRAGVLTRRLLAFSRRQPLQQRLLHLDVVVTDLLGMLRPIIGEQVELEVRAQPNLDPVKADPGQIEQVVLNLCVNSRDAMPEGGRLIIETTGVRLDSEFARTHPWAREGRFVLLTVTDTGHGIPSDVRERLFEPFFTTKDTGEGTGLGLATVYAIVNRHQGMIDFSSESGHGTSFRIYLPVASGEVEKENRAEPAPPAGGHETILLAEDDPVVRSLAVEVLSQAGYRLVLARDGEEAIRLFSQHAAEIDLALLDVVMPKYSGRQVYEKIQASRPDLPTVFISGYSFGTLEKDHLPRGAQDLIQKPYASADLLRRIRTVLDRQAEG